MPDTTPRIDYETRAHVVAHLASARADLISAERLFREGDIWRAKGFAEDVSTNALAVWERLDAIVKEEEETPASS